MTEKNNLINKIFFIKDIKLFKKVKQTIKFLIKPLREKNLRYNLILKTNSLIYFYNMKIFLSLIYKIIIN